MRRQVVMRASKRPLLWKIFKTTIIKTYDVPFRNFSIGKYVEFFCDVTFGYTPIFLSRDNRTI